MAYAHSANSAGQRHDLVDHLTAVAERARSFAERWGGASAAYYAGLWHDLGKFHPDWQSYLLECERGAESTQRGPDHKAAGAVLAEQHIGLGALVVQGHHGGLHDAGDLKTWLQRRAAADDVKQAIRLAERAIPDLMPAHRLDLPADRAFSPRAAEMFFRFMFSALVDADYLDTEAHFKGDRALLRSSTASLADLLGRLERHIGELSGRKTGPVAEMRRLVYESCVKAADQATGLFRLAAPTGAGKTLSAMAFALRHAVKHNLERVIVAVPFISITEQTADVYRSVFETGVSQNVVLEHHSGVYGDDDGEEFHRSSVWNRLAAENWDAPIVVTTTVQLFESLFANNPGPCRKLHRLTNSVIIIDEAQSLPPHHLRAILDGLRELATHYGTTVVVCTATQPAFEVIDEFRGVPAVDIVPDAPAVFDRLRRVDYEWRVEPALTWEEVAGCLSSERQGLAVLNTKKDALALLDALGDPSALHLSTLLCGAHRRAVIAEVKQRLREERPCRLVTTQVVEAGVDIDFPFVMRALGPLDSVIQAAGRCNREGRRERGRVIVFRPAEGGLPSSSAYKIGVGVLGSMLGGGAMDPDDPSTSARFFRLLFETLGKRGLDRDEVQALRERLDYPAVAQRFRMIDDETETVAITSYGFDEERRRVRKWLDRLADGTPDARYLRRYLQPYLVSVRRREAETYRRQGFISPIAPGLGEWLGAYDSIRGLQARDPGPDRLVV